MNGAEYIARFLAEVGLDKVFGLNGGACAFMIDAVCRQPGVDFVAFQHEQPAAMAADAVWRVNRAKMGVTMATSGPGATNLITGIACSFFDSIPSLHITGQVNMRESASYDALGVRPRQAGFQETKIAQMVGPITKSAIQVRTAGELKAALAEAYATAMTGRRGPVLLDVPLDVQMGKVEGTIVLPETGRRAAPPCDAESVERELAQFFAGGGRPLVLFGGGVGFAGVEAEVEAWLTANGIPFVASWAGMTFFDNAAPNYLGCIGVYGNRGANYAIQNCDRLLVLGSRLDNRQRSGNARSFAPGAKVHVVDVDAEELGKYRVEGYGATHLDFADLPDVLGRLGAIAVSATWAEYAAEMKARYYGRDASSFARTHNTLSPYAVVKAINPLIAEDAIVVNDTGAALCWFFQMFHRTRQTVFTAGGNSPMGYALPASIAAKLERPERDVVCFMGDGGFHLNIHELQTVVNLGLDLPIVVFNNRGYGIIKQYQDSYLGARHHASGQGLPDFKRVAEAYGLAHARVETLADIDPALLAGKGARVVEVMLDENTQIEPKLEVGRPINDQYPYVDDDEFAAGNRFVRFERVRT
jgi:acetolactate synthase-1/2/3 large subunit